MSQIMTKKSQEKDVSDCKALGTALQISPTNRSEKEVNFATEFGRSSSFLALLFLPVYFLQ